MTLREQLEALTGERIATLEALGDGKARAPEATRIREMDVEAGGDRSEERSPEPERTPEPKSADRDLGL